MTTKSRLALLSSLAAMPAFAAPFLAIGDNAELFVTARTEARYEDNLTFASKNLIDDFIFEFAPGVELTFGKSSLTKGSVVLYERFLSYLENTENNTELANVIATTTYEGSKLTVRVNGSFRELAQNSRDLAGLAIVRTDVSTLGATAEVSITEKSKVGVGGSYSDAQYVKDNPAYGLKDSSSITVPVNYYFAVRPKLDLSAGVQLRSTTVDGPSNDSDDIFYNVGARGEFTPKLLGSFAVGFNVRDGETNAADDESVGVKAGLTYLYSVKTQFTVDLSNDFDTAATGAAQEKSSVSVGVRSSIAADLSAFASLGYENVDYSTVNREDDFYTGRVGLTYTLNQYISLDAGYNFYINRSSTPNNAATGPSFIANVFSISATARY